MMLTVAMVTWVGVALLKLPLGAAILLGAVLAPTDPCSLPMCRLPIRTTVTVCVFL
jgi:NhaP-type Na+/H+ or K+/H+ antiporter